MLTQSNFSTVQAKVMGNLNEYMPLLKSFKSAIQVEIIPKLTPQELSDIANCNLNEDVVDKLSRLGKIHYLKYNQQNDMILYCICVAIGTIINEYEWGVKYIQPIGVCEMASKILS